MAKEDMQDAGKALSSQERFLSLEAAVIQIGLSVGENREAFVGVILELKDIVDVLLQRQDVMRREVGNHEEADSVGDELLSSTMWGTVNALANTIARIEGQLVSDAEAKELESIKDKMSELTELVEQSDLETKFTALNGDVNRVTSILVNVNQSLTARVDLLENSRSKVGPKTVDKDLTARMLALEKIETAKRLSLLEKLIKRTVPLTNNI